MTGAATVRRLETLVDVADRAGEDTMSFSALHRAVLADGRRLVLLDDRGWSSSVRPPGASAPVSVDEIEHTARFVVGPDEPFGEHTQEDMENDHWRTLAEVLAQQGVAVDAQDLRRLPHDVVLSGRLGASVQS